MLKKLVYIVLSMLILIVGLMFMTGNEHIFFAVQHTYLKGRTGPSIDEYQIYHNRKVDVGPADLWPEISAQMRFQSRSEA